MKPPARKRQHAPAQGHHRSALTAAVLSLLMLVPAPALAHPFFRGGAEVPVRSLTTLELDLAHGCGDEAAGAGSDTDEVALEAPAWLRIVDAPPADGWDVSIEGQDATGAVVVVWIATTGAVPAPRFALEVVVDGVEGETRHLRLSQRCGARIERWVGTPEDPAEQPAVRLRLAAPDPSAPPPPPHATAPAVPEAPGAVEPRDTGAPEEAGATAPVVDTPEAGAPPTTEPRVPTGSGAVVLLVAALSVIAAGAVSQGVRVRRRATAGRRSS